MRERERDKLIELIKDRPSYVSMEWKCTLFTIFSNLHVENSSKSKPKLLHVLLSQIKNMITNGVSTWKYTNVKIFITFIICTL